MFNTDKSDNGKFGPDYRSSQYGGVGYIISERQMDDYFKILEARLEKMVQRVVRKELIIDLISKDPSVIKKMDIVSGKEAKS